MAIATRGREEGGRAFSLPVEPRILQSPAIVKGVVVPGDSLDKGCPAHRRLLVQNDWPGHVLDDLTLGGPDELLSLFRVDLSRLAKYQRIERLVAVASVIAVRPSGVVLDQVDVRIVDCNTGPVQTNGVVLSLHSGEPDAAIDNLELTLDKDVLHLINEDHRRVAISGNVARGNLDFERPLLAVAEALHDTASLGLVLIDAAVTRQARELIGRQAPAARRRWQHDGANDGLALREDGVEGWPIERQRHRKPEPGVIERRRRRVDDHVSGVVAGQEVAYRLGAPGTDVLE